MKARPSKLAVLLLSSAVLALFVVGEMGLAVRRSIAFAPTSARITITDAGINPAVLTVPAGAEVIWYNASSVTYVLQSGEWYQVFLPLTIRGAGNRAGDATNDTAAQPPSSTSKTDATFSATLPPGGTF